MKSAAASSTALAYYLKIIPLKYTTIEKTVKYNESDMLNFKMLFRLVFI